jgi:hypothetical protein
MNAPDFAETRRRADAVRDRFRLSDLIGGDVKLVRRGSEHVGLCPFHADTRAGSFSVNDGKAIYKCFACGAGGDHFDYLKARKGLEFLDALRLLEAESGIDFGDARAKAEYDRRREKREREEADEREQRRRNAEGMWLHAAKLPGTPAQRYLEARGIDFAKLGRFPGALRFRHDATCKEIDRKIPAMLAKMVGADGRHAATHRTYLDRRADGAWAKAKLARPKMVLGSFAGAHIPLSKGSAGVPLARVPDGTTIWISEGIEDGLTIAMAYPDRFVVAAATVGNIATIALPPTVRDIVLICQRDAEGSAADQAVERAIAAH